MSLPYDALAASRELAGRDPRLADVIAQAGPPEIALRPDDTLPALLRSIVYQQLSTKAAATIHGRVLDAFGTAGALDVDAVAAAEDEALRACGLSRQKVAAVRDLVAHQRAGTLPSREALLAMPDAAVVEALTAVRGVGVWTAQMVLMFNLGRPDVWPVGDLGVQEGFRLILGLDDRPRPKAMAGIGEPYAPWRSVAAWYGWRAVHIARGEE